jgi:ribosomal protein S18 acetylase RimI-like enzyme
LNGSEPPAGVSIIAGGRELLDRVRPLWHELRAHHASLDPTWRDGVLATSFDERRSGLVSKSNGGDLLVVLALAGDHPVAYCVCTVTASGDGEVDSLFVTSCHRRRGIGDALMTRAMAWLQTRATQALAVEVMACNEDAVRLYERYGFRPRALRMLQVHPPQSR